MSRRGEIVPELAALLGEIAERIEGQTADTSDAAALRRLARVAAGKDKLFSIKVHGRRGQRPLGASGVDRRFAMARAIKAHMDEHECSNEAAREALNGLNDVGPETLRKAWQEMSPLLEMSEERRNLILYFKRLEARGLAKVTRIKR
jgi:hypothetical protein